MNDVNDMTAAEEEEEEEREHSCMRNDIVRARACLWSAAKLSIDD